jgi:sulfate/thiosulfate transport system substrate-binding protein
MTTRTFRIPFLAATIAVLAAFGAAGCGGSASGASDKLSLVAYSTPKEAYEELIPAFAKTPAGKGVKFSQSYGASGEQARAVIAGLKADVVALSLAPDVGKLVDKGLVAKNWSEDAHDGFVTNSVVVFAVRTGNPKGIRTWDDLVKPGVEVIEPNPFTSGGARWNVMAAYGAQLEQGRSEAEAKLYLGRLFKNVAVQDKSAREALQTFSAGKGDVLLAYENEALTAQAKGEDIDYVIPDQTILIQNPVAVTSNSKNVRAAKAFVEFLRTPDAQKVFAAKGYRTVLESEADTKKYPVPAKLFKIDDLGGWSKVNKTFFDPEKGVMAKIEQDLGVGTS